MESIWLNWFLLIGVFGLAVASPGPDFVIAVRNSVLGSCKAGLLTALGFATGVVIHMAYTLVGLAAIIANSVVLYSILKYVGAAYLFYMGYKSLRSKGFDDSEVTGLRGLKKEISNKRAFLSGFVTNILNPKATLFFLAVFSQFITADTAFSVQFFYASTCVVMTGLWFSIVAVVLTDRRIKNKFLSFSQVIDRLCGGFLIALSLKLALSKA
ncbi:MAG: LysE family transporter [Alphaproteobacteria bacterium]|nr:LysE family transporter [Alphaproteobacteria bacterium]